MIRWIIGFLSPKETEADRQFARFIQLRGSFYASLLLSDTDSINSLHSPPLSSACRRWLPELTDPLDRVLCSAIAMLHDPEDLYSYRSARQTLGTIINRSVSARLPCSDSRVTLPYLEENHA